MGGGYSKDNFDVYFRGRKIEDASASSFKYLGGGYGKDNWKVIYQGRVVEDASGFHRSNIRRTATARITGRLSLEVKPLVVKIYSLWAVVIQKITLTFISVEKK